MPKSLQYLLTNLNTSVVDLIYFCRPVEEALYPTKERNFTYYCFRTGGVESICGIEDVHVTKGRHTQADNMKLLVHFGTLSVPESIGLRCSDKLHSVRVPTIGYPKIRYIF